MLAAPFEVVPCDTFITEATFGLPVYRWRDTGEQAQAIEAWRAHCAARGEAAILYCYALGKAQRVLAAHLTQPVLVHGAIAAGVDVYRQAGIALPATETLGEASRGETTRDDYTGRLVLAPPSALGSAWLRRFRRAQQGFGRQGHRSPPAHRRDRRAARLDRRSRRAAAMAGGCQLSRSGRSRRSAGTAAG